ncbi:MAG: hypothetical protein ACXW5U_15825 [Thermoanaerobaculia bacterium]
MTDKIGSLFDPSKDIYRKIEKVVQYDARSPERLKAEISEYVATESIQQQLEKFVEDMDAAMGIGGERNWRLGLRLLRIGQELAHEVSRLRARRQHSDRRPAVP